MNAGFVLPTVAMVSIVVILLATAIMFRSFDRAKNASNVRVNEAVLSAATPAIDRGRAKFNKLFQDKRLPRATPTDAALYTVLKEKLNEYTFGDETPLKLTYKYKDKNNQEITDTLETAWRFPVDTDNNGKFDSYTLYGIYFKTPPVSSDNKYSRARNPLEARTPPMAQGTLDTNCGANTSAVLVGNTGWIKQNNELKKSFFVYTATVPITSDPPTADKNKYEQYKGNKGFAAVEYQQDRVQIPPNNYAVVYEDDIALTPGPNFNLNGSVFTNSNLLTAGVNGGQIQFYQVSAKASCFYEAKNAKIIVGGNLALGGFTSASHSTSKTPKVDLFKGKTVNVDSKDWVRSVNSSNSPRDTAYNNLAYVSRINRLVAAQMLNNSDSDPSEVKNGIEKKKKNLGLSSFTTAEEDKIRRQQLESYFRKRTRRVPFAEVGFNGTDTDPTPLLQGSGDTLRPNDKWIYPTDPTDGKTGTNYTKLSLNISSTSLEPKATEPKELKKDGGKEAELGDRVLVGNNLPELWWDKTKNQFVGSGIEDTQQISGIKWDKPTDTKEIRTRRSLVQTLADVGSTERDGEWELDAAKIPGDPTEPVGGLRVVTGAGIYLNQGGTPGSFDNTVTTIWPDTMPVPQAGLPVYKNPDGTPKLDADKKPITFKTIQPYWMYAYMTGASNDIASLTYTWPEPSSNNVPRLQMRATAVYHYKSTNYNPQNPKPIACVSSFYVPTNSTTAKNINTLPDTAKDKDGNFIIQKDASGLSNNGIVYPAPTKTITDYSTALTYQSQLKYPNGRLIDDGLLARALGKTAANRTISEQSAIDAQICALQIKYDSTFQPVTSSPVIPHGAIREITLLDSREVKQNSISSTPPSQTYDLPIRDRQPLEIRTTVLDLDLLRKTTIGNTTPSQEYLLPNSGLIYATRDGALPDMSADITTLPLPTSNSTPTEANKLVSPVDYRLDPTRRPNAIMLVNGDKLWRTETYRDVEKGLILATNLPVYIKGNFNRHTKEEFEQQLNDDWSQNFYSRSTLDKNFACRKGDPRLIDCTTGDEWRPATVLADAITLLSGTFKEGFRDQGDYDWSHNNLASVPTGFSKYNNFVTNTKWYDDTGKPNYFSSYLNNFVTPVLLRTVPGAYLTEVCPVTNGKGTIGTGNSAIQVDAEVFCSDPKNWTIQTSCGEGGGNTYLNDKIVGKNGDPSNSRIKTGYIFDDPESFGEENNKGPKCFDDNAPRRIAFVRDSITGNITSPLQVFGVDKTGNVQRFDFGSSKSKIGTELMSPPNGVTMPWLQPTITLGNITALTPILQLRQPFATPSSPTNTDTISGNKDNRKWLQEAADTTFNLIIVAGDSPARSDGNNSEDNGGLHNFVRFMENWQPTSGNSKARISGSFMQVKKSAYATGPYTTAFSDGTNNELKYAIEISSGRGTGYLPPTRQWGYDVALLSQAPDLFANKLILTPPDLPDEYFREVGRDDKWVETLLCAKNGADNTNAIASDQRPSTCKS